MSATNHAIRILLIRPWTVPLAPLRAAFVAAAVTPRFHRVDIEPALNAALHRGGHDVILLDPRTPGLSRELVAVRMREHQCTRPLVLLEHLDTVAADVQRALRSHLN